MHQDHKMNTFEPFFQFSTSLIGQSPLREKITDHYCINEPIIVEKLLSEARFSIEDNNAIYELSKRLVEHLKKVKHSGKQGIIQDLLQEYALSSDEGIALMCLAEALLRIPDKGTRDALIKDKIAPGDWKSHLKHQKQSTFVNAATWGLAITGKLVATHNENSLGNAINKILAKGGAPLIRKGVDIAMRMMGEQFVTGETIEKALKNAAPMVQKGFLYSYDMLGEAALTEADAKKYMDSYRKAIHAIGKDSKGKGIYKSSGISIKLSAIHPRYSRAQYDRIMNEMYPRLLELMLIAKQYDIGVNIDAEEANRLELSLDLLEKLCFEPDLQNWDGIGFVIQAYQKRCSWVIDYLIDLAKRSGHRLMVRLVKGAYWDSEIKFAQIEGYEDYPVYTKKVHTDISYIACAKKLLGAKEVIYPQFASHNARTLASVYVSAGGHSYKEHEYEFQCLHGMGETLYEQVVGDQQDGKLGVPCRIYAPVGTHETLLAYLVRRLLENGANTSFVNLIADPNVSMEALLVDPVAQVEEDAEITGVLGKKHEKIALPLEIYGVQRKNSKGLNLSNEQVLNRLANDLLKSGEKLVSAYPRLDGLRKKSGEILSIKNPANLTDIVGFAQFATAAEATEALSVAKTHETIWQSVTFAERARILNHAADLLEQRMHEFLAILVREAGKTYNNAVAEVREAIDFLRFYAWQANNYFNNHTHVPLGTVVCISPWNFPLAIYIGQISAALVSGNVVIAKPAEQTVLVASKAVDLLLEAGIPEGVLQFLPGEGGVLGDILIKDARVNGVMFTGSTEVAKILAKNLSHRLNPNGEPVPLIAETGGQNAMIVDSSALTEQVVTDAMISAFDSAGQRCSALRILCVQEECSDRVIEMLKGTMKEFRIGNPELLSIDMGPVIDLEAKDNIIRHIETMTERGYKVHQLSNSDLLKKDTGYFVLPTLIEIENINELQKEVFGPVLHVIRYKRKNLKALVQSINETGFGLTFGVHSRIDETIETLSHDIHAGNIYVNRNVVGAVVGVQPFGGEGLSGTGPKAGGPLYLYRLLSQYPKNDIENSLKGLDSTMDRTGHDFEKNQALVDVIQWLKQSSQEDLVKLADETGLIAPIDLTLTGPTGEKNIYQIHHREKVLCIADEEKILFAQIMIVIKLQSKVYLENNKLNNFVFQQLPVSVQSQILFFDDFESFYPNIDTVIYSGDRNGLIELLTLLANKGGVIPKVTVFNRDTLSLSYLGLLKETSISINTAAAGGNANLMMIG